MSEFPMYLVESSQFLVTRHTPHRGCIRVLIIKKKQKHGRIDLGCVGSRMDIGRCNLGYRMGFGHVFGFVCF